MVSLGRSLGFHVLNSCPTRVLAVKWVVEGERADRLARGSRYVQCSASVTFKPLRSINGCYGSEVFAVKPCPRSKSLPMRRRSLAIGQRDVCQTYFARKLYAAMVELVDDDFKKRVEKEDELLPGGDIRVTGNQWIRVAFRNSGLGRVPRETQLRLTIQKVVGKKKLGRELS